MPAFATPDELAAEWRPLTTAERAAATSHLDTVAALIRSAFADHLGLSEVPADKLTAARSVSIDIVKTALATGMWPGHTSYSRTEGPRSKSGTLASPGGSLTLSEWHRDLLGLPVRPAPAWCFPRDDY